MKTMETTCVSNELCRFEGGEGEEEEEEKEEEEGEEKRPIASSGDSCMKHAKSSLVCEFGGFEKVLHDVGVRAIPI